jgi:hypothetical protein
MKQLFSFLFLFAFVSGLLFAQEANITMSFTGEVVKYVGSPDAILFDQTGTVTTIGYASQQFGDFPTYSCQLADDFVVPAGVQWTIQTIVAPGQLTAAGGFTTALVEFYNNSGTLPGTVVATQTAAVTDVGGLVTATLAPTVVLNPGTYWVSVSVIGDFGVYGQWYWYTSTSTNGSNMAWQNPGNGFGTGFTTWTAGATVWPGSDYDLAFQLNGTSAPSGFALPEVLYYLFDETGTTQTTNYAVPGRGTATASLFGGLTMGPTGQFNSGLIGAGGTGATDYVNTGWATDIGTSSWTISLWLNNLVAGTALNYFFGDPGAASYRCFLNGIAGVGAIALRGGGLTDIFVPNIAPGPTVVHFVYDATIPDVKAYVNGALALTVPQVALNINGAGPFKVGGYSTSAGMSPGSVMDEFRYYSRALDAAEVLATWNISIVPVELTSFTASVTGSDVKLLWETASELNNSGFSIERKYSNTEFMEVGFVPGFGTTSEPKSYSFTDNNLRSGIYSYRLKQIDFDGTFTYSDEVEVEVIAPASFSLDQNYPNPFNPSTRISFSLAVDSKVSLKIFDVLGQEVASLVNQDLTQGVHTYDFNAAGINSGVYFYKLEATGVNGNEFTDVKKMILVK